MIWKAFLRCKQTIYLYFILVESKLILLLINNVFLASFYIYQLIELLIILNTLISLYWL
jgi:hypothetical protein